jgi:hypothetical protein
VRRRPTTCSRMCSIGYKIGYMRGKQRRPEMSSLWMEAEIDFQYGWTNRKRRESSCDTSDRWA